jgi:hypothetical protein
MSKRYISMIFLFKKQLENIAKLENEVSYYKTNQCDPTIFINYSSKIQDNLNTRQSNFYEKVQTFYN